MDKYIEELYRDYQKKADSIILKTYNKLLDEKEVGTLSEYELVSIDNKLKAIKEVIKERDLKVKKRTPKKPNSYTDAGHDLKSNEAFQDGVKAFVIGIACFAISLVLMNSFGGNKIFLIGVLIGAFKLMQGIITMAISFYVNFNNKTRR